MKQYINDHGKWGTFDERYSFDLGYALKVFTDTVNHSNAPEVGELVGIEREVHPETTLYIIVKITKTATEE